ncbi:uncharacterized protein LOC143218884 [Lasioglossum baleicum]|uniref:uncharacterized protein LOC143218884 n=1 Tax=Lasioglossum baleicum TaxID=434251 RepID=UPI003FCE34EE
MLKLNPAVIALSETRLTAEIEDSEINVPGYSVVRCDAETRNTGGVVLYVRDDIKYEIVVSKKLERIVWCVAIEVKEKLFKGVVMVIYHSPSASHGEFIGFLEDIVEELTIKEECIILGDFNIDCKTDSYYTNKLLTTMQSLGMKQHVDKPTRVTKNSETIIDLVFTNKEINVVVSYEPKITDHAWIKVAINTNKTVNKYKEFSGRDYNRYSAEEFVKLVESNLGKGQELDINLRARKLINSIVDALDTSAPKKIFRIPKIWEGKIWYSKEIEELATKRDEAYRKAMYDSTEQNWHLFKTQRNAVWKTSTIIPIPKVGKPKRASDYRPINMLPIYEKVVEIIVKKQVEAYLESNNIITEHQSGFRKSYSCETAIQTVIDEWKLFISERQIVGVIFVDLKRAFETIDRGRLLEKLYQYGITGTVLEWFRSYLKDRTQQVRLNEEWSKILETEYGVPQGSRVRRTVELWMNTNKLKLNAVKTKYMLVRGVQKLIACFKRCKFMNIRQRLYYNVCIFIFKIVNNMMPMQLSNRLRIVGEARETRQAGDIVIEFRKTRSAQKSLFYEEPLLRLIRYVSSIRVHSGDQVFNC